MTLRLTIFLAALLLSGCVSTGKYKELEIANFKLEREVKLHKEAETGNLVEKYKACMGQIDALHRDKAASDVAMDYMKRKGWKPVRVEEKVNLKENKYDYIGKEYVVISEGLSGKALYEASVMSSLVMVRPGTTLAKDNMFGIVIIDSMGTEIELMRK